MIDINLVPDNSRRKRKAKIISTSAFQLPQEAIIGLVGGLLALLILVHSSLLLIIWRKASNKKELEKEWQVLLPVKEKTDRLSNELRTLQGKMSSIEKITTSQRILWAPKLNVISDILPRGVWINKISFADGLLLIEGSVVSKMSNEMTTGGSLASILKKQKIFTEHLSNVEVGSIQRRKIKNVEIADFSITAKSTLVVAAKPPVKPK